MEFKRYSSIPRDNKSGTNVASNDLKYFVERGFADVKCAYFQKVHGANFGIYFNGEDYRVATRNNFITEEQNAWGNHWVALLEEMKPNIKNIWDTLKAENPAIKQIVLHSELAGGHYNGEGVGYVQGNTHYCKNQFIYLFDIRIFWDETMEDGVVETQNTVINPLKSVELFEREGLLHAKVIGTGTLSECLKVTDKTNYVSIELEGGEIVPAEGIVIKSIEDGRLYSGESRIIIKRINAEFEESKSKKNNKKNKVRDKDVPLEALEYVQKAEAHATMMRLDKVCGNNGWSEANFNPKEFGLVVKAMQADIIKEMEDSGIALDPTWMKYVNKKLSSMVAPLIREKLI